MQFDDAKKLEKGELIVVEIPLWKRIRAWWEGVQRGPSIGKFVAFLEPNRSVLIEDWAGDQWEIAMEYARPWKQSN